MHNFALCRNEHNILNQKSESHSVMSSSLQTHGLVAAHQASLSMEFSNQL